MIAAPRTLRAAVPATGFGNTRTPIRGLTLEFFLRSSLIAALGGVRILVGCRYRQIQNGLPALTFHNSRFDQEIDGRFERDEVARMEQSAILGMACRWDTSHE